jgi:hypothetical protein
VTFKYPPAPPPPPPSEPPPPPPAIINASAVALNPDGTTSEDEDVNVW